MIISRYRFITNQTKNFVMIKMIRTTYSIFFNDAYGKAWPFIQMRKVYNSMSCYHTYMSCGASVTLIKRTSSFFFSSFFLLLLYRSKPSTYDFKEQSSLQRLRGLGLPQFYSQDFTWQKINEEKPIGQKTRQRMRRLMNLLLSKSAFVAH